MGLGDIPRNADNLLAIIQKYDDDKDIKNGKLCRRMKTRSANDVDETSISGASKCGEGIWDLFVYGSKCSKIIPRENFHPFSVADCIMISILSQREGCKNNDIQAFLIIS